MAASKVTMMLGIIPLAVRMEKAVDDSSSGNRTVCLGQDEPHDPTRVQMRMTCPVCDRYHSSVYGYEHRARELGDELVVLTRDEIAETIGEPITGRPGKPPVEVRFHPREKVYGATVASDSVQNIYPDRGGEKAYSLLRDTLRDQPDVVAVIIWAPRSANALWVLEVVENRLVASKRSWPEYVRTTQAVPDVDILPAEQAMFMQFVDAVTEDFDLSVYSDQAKLKLDALVESRAGQAIPIPTSTPTAPGIGDLLAGLQANIDAVKARKAPAKRTARKAPAKKAVAKKAPAKKAAPARKKVA